MTVVVVIGLLAAWLFIALVCLGLCVSAARGDRGMSAPHLRLVDTRRFGRGHRSAA